MNKGNVLIVEDEVLIASHIQSCIEDFGFKSVGIAVSYDEAVEFLNTSKVDVVLLDINLSGKKSGIDLANLINKTYKKPFIYLTSYSDSVTIEELKKTLPKAYLSKPINETDVTTTLSIILNNVDKKVSLSLGKTTFHINLKQLIYIKTDHVYIELFFLNKKEMIRMSMSSILDQLPESSLLQINRSVAVNPEKIIKKEGNKLYLQNNLEFKISDKYLHNFN